MIQIDPKDLIARLTCECGGTGQVGHLPSGPPGSQPGPRFETCPHCTNLDDDEPIIEIVQHLVGWYDNPDYDDGLARAYVKTAEFCALRGIEPIDMDPPWGRPPTVRDTIAFIATDRIVMEMDADEWAGGAFDAIQSLANQADLDLAGAVEEVMRDKEGA